MLPVTAKQTGTPNFVSTRRRLKLAEGRSIRGPVVSLWSGGIGFMYGHQADLTLKTNERET